jgi:hypothetical protein
MNYTKHQQGDVILLKVSEEVFNKDNNQLNHRTNTHSERAVLAEGEATGHYHAVYMKDMLDNAGITLCANSEYDRQNRGIIVTGAPVELKHEEHDTITLEPGYYLQRIVKEYDHISGITRRVAD